MAEETTPILAGFRVSTTFRGLLHFPHSIDMALVQQLVFDGSGTSTSLSIGGANNGATITGILDVTDDTNIKGNLSVSKNTIIDGDVTLTNGGLINDVKVLSSGSDVSIRSLRTAEAGKLRIRDVGSNDYELIFGNPDAITVKNVFTIKVNSTTSKNLYIKHRYAEADLLAPLWINWTTGEVNIRNLRVSKVVTIPDPGTVYPPGRDPDPHRSEIAIGSIMMFPSLTIPPGWLECNGQILNRGTYPELWDVISNTYGAGSVPEEYRVPDFRGLFVRGLDHKRDDEATNLYLINRQDPQSGRILGASTQSDSIKTHHHGISNTALNSDARCKYDGGAGAGGGPGGPVVVAVKNSATDCKQFILQDSAGSNTGDTGDVETRPKNIAIVYCIKW